MSNANTHDAILIDGKTGVAKKVQINTDGEAGYKAISEAIGCEYFTAVTIKKYDDGSNDCLYCDDVGAVNGTNYGVLHYRYGPIHGHCLVLGAGPDGETKSCRSKLGELENIGMGFVFSVDENGKHSLKRISIEKPE